MTPTAAPTAVENARAALAAALERAPEVDLEPLGVPAGREGWSLWPDALRLLAALVEALRPAHVLELGSGLSTVLLAHACAEHAPGCRITSVDGDPDWSASVAARVGGRGAAVVQQVAPVVLREFGGDLLPAYRLDPAAFACAGPLDLVLVDGPPEPLGGREATLYQVLPFTRPGTLVLLDDAGRPGEQAAIAHWRERLGGAVELWPLRELTGGMAAAIVREPLPREALWPRRVEAAAAAIAAAVPATAAVAVVDECAFGDGLALAAGRRLLVFGERDGVYWGAPENDEAALAELGRVRAAGATYVAVVWPALWWLDHYPGFAAALGSPVAADSNVLVFAAGQP